MEVPNCECLSGHYPVTTSTNCEKCMDTCLECNDDRTCSKCDNSLNRVLNEFTE